MGETVGYARVSSAGQSLSVQLEKLKHAGCDRIFDEKRSGASAHDRTQLKDCLQYVRSGDVLVVTRLDRLARSLVDLLRIMGDLERREVSVRILDQGFDTSTSEGRLMLHMLGAFAEFENAIRRERQMDGIQKAKHAGVRFGRRKVLSSEQEERIRRLRTEERFSIGQLAERFAVSSSTVYRVLRVHSQDAGVP